MSSAASLHDRAEELASTMSLRSLSPVEAEDAVNVILDLVAEGRRLRDRLARHEWYPTEDE